MCAILEWLGCAEAFDTPAGQPCTTGLGKTGVCEETLGIPNFELPTSCVAASRTVVDVRKCGVKCR